MRSYYKPGDYNAICYECGRVRKASELRKHWQGYFVCSEHWEPRHPQDFVRGVVDNQSVPNPQPESDRFIPFCSMLDIQGVAGMGVAGCMVAGQKIQAFIDSGTYIP